MLTAILAVELGCDSQGGCSGLTGTIREGCATTQSSSSLTIVATGVDGRTSSDVVTGGYPPNVTLDRVLHLRVAKAV